MSGNGERDFLNSLGTERLLEDLDSVETEPAGGRVLLLLRDRKESSFLHGQLIHLGYQVTAIRNPFSALDALRSQQHDLILSEFDVWADDGRLLFDRLRLSEEVVPVIFVLDSSEPAKQALSAGAVGVVVRPVHPGDLEEAVRSAQSTAPTVSQPPRRGRGALLDETEWLRFFFQVRRSARTSSKREERLARMVSCFAEFVRPRAVFVAEQTVVGIHLVLSEEFRKKRAGQGRSDHRYWGELFEEALSDRGKPNQPNQPGVLRLNFAVATGHPGQFLAHFGDELPAGLSEYCEELRLLLEDA